MEWYVGPAVGEALIGFHHFPWIGILERNDKTLETKLVHQIAVIGRRFNNRLQLVIRVLGQKGWRDRTAIHSNANRETVMLCDIDQPFHFMLYGLGFLDVMQMAGVVTDLVDEWSNLVGDLVVLL